MVNAISLINTAKLMILRGDALNVSLDTSSMAMKNAKKSNMAVTMSMEDVPLAGLPLTTTHTKRHAKSMDVWNISSAGAQHALLTMISAITAASYLTA